MEDKPKAWIGVDPGSKGALVLLCEDNSIEICDVDDSPFKVLSWLREMCDKYTVQRAALEYVHALPKQGVSSTFKFGRWYGLLEMALIACGIPFELVSPRKWKKGVIRKEDGKDLKTASLNAARRLFPNAMEYLKRKKDHDRAEALLMALYAKRNF